MIRNILGLAAGLTLTTAASAQQTICFTDTIPLSTTNWADSVSVPKFDPLLGDLQSIQFRLTGNIQGSAAAESLDATPTVVTLSFAATMTLTRPDMSVLVIAIPLATFNDAFTAFDNVIDFAGASGETHAGLNVTQTETVTSPPPVSDLALFTGLPGNPGTIVLPVTAAGASTAVGAGNLITQFMTQAAASVEVCYTYTVNTPPSFTSCPGNVMATAGVPVSFQVCAADVDVPSVVTLTSGPLPPGATMTPALPTSGNPVCSTFNWTPTVADIGNYVIAFTALDDNGRSATCTVSLLVAECYQLLGRGGEGSNINIGGTLFHTQLTSVRQYWPVTMTDRPSMRVPMIASGQINFSFETLMRNIDMFPTNPDQWSNRLRVTVLPGGIVSGDLLGSLNGIHMTFTTFTDPNGDLWMTFPFTIDGM